MQGIALSTRDTDLKKTVVFRALSGSDGWMSHEKATEQGCGRGMRKMGTSWPFPTARLVREALERPEEMEGKGLNTVSRRNSWNKYSVRGGAPHRNLNGFRLVEGRACSLDSAVGKWRGVSKPEAQSFKNSTMKLFFSGNSRGLLKVLRMEVMSLRKLTLASLTSEDWSQGGQTEGHCSEAGEKWVSVKVSHCTPSKDQSHYQWSIRPPDWPTVSVTSSPTQSLLAQPHRLLADPWTCLSHWPQGLCTFSFLSLEWSFSRCSQGSLPYLLQAFA